MTLQELQVKYAQEGSRRVFRGWSWFNFALNARASYRGFYVPGDRFDSLGFRLVRKV